MGQQSYMIIVTLILSSNIFISCSSLEDHQSSALDNSPPLIANVADFGAMGDGNDDSEAFELAWKAACSSKNGHLVVSQNRVYRLKPMVLYGPCLQNTTVEIYGTLMAPTAPSQFGTNRLYWLLFYNIENLKLIGSGIIYGNGEFWWGLSCKQNPSLPCISMPSALTFSRTTNLIVQGLKVKNSPGMHFVIEYSTNVFVTDLVVAAPGTSPNTDGIHITASQNVRIQRSCIRTGDDCISMVTGSNGIHIEDIKCGPGHGISVGSLGKGNSEAQVSNVWVGGVLLSGTTNGARIKSWVGGRGYARNISFQNIVMQGVGNPIIIDQYYCDQRQPCPTGGSAVEITDVVYKDINGSSLSPNAITFHCSSTSPCRGLTLQNINLVTEAGGKSIASCVNANGFQSDSVIPSCKAL